MGGYLQLITIGEPSLLLPKPKLPLFKYPGAKLSPFSLAGLSMLGKTPPSLQPTTVFPEPFTENIFVTEKTTLERPCLV